MTSRVSSDSGYFGLTKRMRHIGTTHPTAIHHSIATRIKLLQCTCQRSQRSVRGFRGHSDTVSPRFPPNRTPMIMRAHLAVLVIALVAAQPASAQQPDPYIWLEQQTGDRAMVWVRTENAKTSAVLEKDPHFSRLYTQALTVAQSNDRIPDAQFIGGE